MKMIFMGRKKYSAELLEWTVNQGIEVVRVCTDSQFPDSLTMLKAKELGIPVVSMEEAEEYVINNPGDIDVVVSYLYWRKIRKPLIDGPKYGCINFHPALLPDYRGTAGYNVAILNKLPEWGATAHYVDEEIDTGSIIRIFKFDFDYRTATAQTLEEKTQTIQVELYKSVVLDVMKKGRLECVPQNKSEGIYISRQEMNDMKQVDLDSVTSDELDLKIRAFWFPPYDGANIEVDGKKYTLINSEILKSLQPKDVTSLL